MKHFFIPIKTHEDYSELDREKKSPLGTMRPWVAKTRWYADNYLGFIKALCYKA